MTTSISQVGKTLMNCSTTIKASCPELTLNSTIDGECTTTLMAFKNKSTECLSSSGSTACSCWANLTSLRSKINRCNIKTYLNTIKASKSSCTSAFTACKKAQDKAVAYVSTCSQDSNSILDNLKTLGDNEEATDQVLAKINESMSDSSSNSTRRKRVSETVTTEVYITRVTTFISLLSTNLYSSSISTLSTQITQTVISGSFTSTQITTLTTQRTSIVSQKTSFTTAKSALQEQYKTITGSYASSSEIRVGSSSSGTSSSLVQIKILTINRASVASVLVKVEEAIAGTAGNSTVNVVEESVFLTYIRNFNRLVRTDYFSESVRSSSMVITSASVTVTSTTLTSLTEVKTTITEELALIDAKLTVIQNQITKLSGSTADSSQIALGSLAATESSVMQQTLVKLKIMTENKEAAMSATKSMEEV